jgi:hypothetical protein
LCRDAGIEALDEDLDAVKIKNAHFEIVLQQRSSRITIEKVAISEGFDNESGDKRLCLSF